MMARRLVFWGGGCLGPGAGGSLREGTRLDATTTAVVWCMSFEGFLCVVWFGLVWFIFFCPAMHARYDATGFFVSARSRYLLSVCTPCKGRGCRGGGGGWYFLCYMQPFIVCCLFILNFVHNSNGTIESSTWVISPALCYA